MNEISLFIALSIDDVEWFEKNEELYRDVKIIPVSFHAVCYLIFKNKDRNKYIVPIVDRKKSCSDKFIEISEITKKFLDKLNKQYVELYKETEFSFFHLELFWNCLITGVFRFEENIQDIISRYKIEKAIILENSESVCKGGLLLEKQSYIEAIKKILNDNEIKYNCVKQENIIENKPKTLFYGSPDKWYMKLNKALRIIYRWIFRLSGGFDDEVVVVNPAHDIIHIREECSSPYMLYDNGMIMGKEKIKFFLRNIIETVKYLSRNPSKKDGSIKDFFLRIRLEEENIGKSRINLAKVFEPSIERYILDAKYMKKYTDKLWHTMKKYCSPKILMFSMPPVHMFESMLFQKARKEGMKVVSWQHGGFYGYTNHAMHFLEDYTMCDYFMSYGDIDLSKLEKYDYYKDKVCKVKNVGSIRINKIMEDYGLIKSSVRNRTYKGMYMPAIMGEYYTQTRPHWDVVSFVNMGKDISDLLGCEKDGKFIIKTFKDHAYHELIRQYIDNKGRINLAVVSDNIDRVMKEYEFDFIILDAPSTALLEVLPVFNGTVFLIVNQESWQLIDDARELLKRRVIYSESFDEFLSQYRKYRESGMSGFDCDNQNMDFMKKYCNLEDICGNYNRAITRIKNGE